MGELFLIGTVWFYVLVVFAWIMITVSTELDEPAFWGSIVLVGTLVLLYFGGNNKSFNNAFLYIKENPGLIILYFFIYLILGTIWSFIKWYFFLLAKKKYYKKYTYGFNMDNYTASQHKGMIINWMMYWPLSGFWTLINQPVRRAFKAIFSRFEKQYEKMANKVLGDIKKDK